MPLASMWTTPNLTWLGVGLTLIGVALVLRLLGAKKPPVGFYLQIAMGLGGAIIVIVVVIPIFTKPPVIRAFPTHKPVNVANINDIVDEGSEPGLFAGAAGTGRVYFVANGTLHADGSFGGSPAIRIYRDDGGTVRAVQDEPRDQRPSSLAVIPGATAADDVLVFVEGGQLRCHTAAGYQTGGAASGTPVVQAMLQLRVVGSDCMMLAVPAPDTVALYHVVGAPPHYELEASSSVGAKSLHAFELSSEAWRRAVFLVDDAGTRKLYRWPSSGAPVLIGVPNVRRVHSGPQSLLFTTKVDLAAGSLHTVVRAASDGTVTALPCDPPPGSFDDVYGIQSWNGNAWVLGRHGSVTQLWQVAPDKLVKVQDVGSIGMLPSGDPQAPRGLVPMATALGFVSGDATFWNISAVDLYSATAAGLTGVDTLWAIGGVGYCAADSGSPLSVEPWRWDS